jgi:hypothetical protein
MSVNLQNSYKLVTKEDPYHLHKTLGLICLYNFFYRFYLLFTIQTMNLNNNYAVGLI